MHVICIQKGQKVRDDIALEFTKKFYVYLFDGKNICDAFDQAKEWVEQMFLGENEQNEI